MTRDGARLRRLRRTADALGLRLCRPPEWSGRDGQHGLRLLVDGTDYTIVASGMSDLDGVAVALAAAEPGSEEWQRGEHQICGTENGGNRADVDGRMPERRRTGRVAEPPPQTVTARGMHHWTGDGTEYLFADLNSGG